MRAHKLVSRKGRDVRVWGVAWEAEGDDQALQALLRPQARLSHQQGAKRHQAWIQGQQGQGREGCRP